MRPPDQQWQYAARWVLLPGTLATPEVFAPLMQALQIASHRRQVIELDKPHVNDYRAQLADAIQPGDVVCGFSLGAITAAHNLAALSRASAIILLACTPHPDPPENRTGRNILRDRVLAGEARDWVAENADAMVARPDGVMIDKIADMAEACVHLIAAQTELAASRPGALEAIKNTQVPIFFVTGMRDRLTPPERVRDLVEQASSATLITIDGLGHYALIEDPQKVANAIGDAVSEIEPSPFEDHLNEAS
ncbi:MAG: alpha/beta hydrolase [Pseudomonadota bacterium]